MNCPLCGAEDIRRDHVAPRAYALLLAGFGTLAVTRVFAADVIALQPERQQQLFFLGVAALMFGALDLIRNPNRWCADCGYRFRRCRGVRVSAATAIPAGTAAAVSLSDAAPVRATAARAELAVSAGSLPTVSRPGAKYIRGLSERERSGGGEPDPLTPLEPVIACLRFSDRKMREQAAATLRRLTGLDFGEDHAAWKAWFDANRDAYYARKREEKKVREHERK